MALGLVGTFLLQTSLSIGLNLVGSWLNPSKGNQVAEDVPNLGSGQPLYSVWGTSFCPSNLLYAVPASRIGASEETSSYGVLTLANPDNTCSLVAVRANNLIVSSLSPLFNLNAPTNVIPGTSKYVNTYGMTTYNNFNFSAQLGSNVANPDFATLGYGGLQYQGLGWLRVIKSDRKLYGGFNSRLTVYYKNRITNSTNIPYNVTFDNPVTVQVTIASPAFFNTIWYDIPFQFPHGFFGIRVFHCFEGAGSYSVVGISGGEDYVIYESIPTYDNVYFKVLSSIVPGGAPAAQGQFSQSPLPLSATNQGNSSTVIVGAANQKLYQITLSSPQPTPFYSNNGAVYNSLNQIIANVPLGTKVYGWAGKMFANTGDVFYPIIGGNLIAGSPAVSGVYNEAYTNLSTILTDLLVAKGIDVSKIQFTANFTDVQVRGYTETTERAQEKIIDLCTAYAKIVDEGFDGVFKFSDYPSDSVISATYSYADLYEDPEIVYTPEIQQPSQVELTYRNWQTEYSERTVAVGYGTPYPNVKTVRYNLVLTETEAKKLAWNTLFLTSHTNMSVRLRVDNINGVEAGSIITLQNPSTAAIKLVVANIEIGADRTYMLNCVNYVPLSSLLSTVNTTGDYTSYMLGISTSPTTGAAATNTVTPFLISAEPTTPDSSDPLAGTLFYTNDGSSYSSYTNNGNLVPALSRVPSSAGYIGRVTGISSTWGSGSLGGVMVIMNADPANTATVTANGIIRIGNSWCSYGAVSTAGNITILSDVRYGLYASEAAIYVGDRVIQVDPSNLVKSHQATLSLFNPAYVEQSASTFTLYGTPPDTQTPAGVAIGAVTTQYPYGYPAAGVVVAKLSSSYYAGVLKVWFTQPGNQPLTGFLLDNNISTNVSPYTSYWVKPLIGSAIFLGTGLSGYQEFNVTLTPGQYTIYQQSSGAVNLPAGSYIWTGTAI